MMEIETSHNPMWSIDSNWNDPVIDSSEKSQELKKNFTPIQRISLNNADIETPPDNLIESKKHMEVGNIKFQHNTSGAIISVPNFQPTNFSQQNKNTNSNSLHSKESLLTPVAKRSRNHPYPSPIPSNKSFSLNQIPEQATSSKLPFESPTISTHSIPRSSATEVKIAFNEINSDESKGEKNPVSTPVKSSELRKVVKVSPISMKFAQQLIQVVDPDIFKYQPKYDQSFDYDNLDSTSSRNQNTENEREQEKEVMDNNLSDNQEEKTTNESRNNSESIFNFTPHESDSKQHQNNNEEKSDSESDNLEESDDVFSTPYKQSPIQKWRKMSTLKWGINSPPAHHEFNEIPDSLLHSKRIFARFDDDDATDNNSEKNEEKENTFHNFKNDNSNTKKKPKHKISRFWNDTGKIEYNSSEKVSSEKTPEESQKSPLSAIPLISEETNNEDKLGIEEKITNEERVKSEEKMIEKKHKQKTKEIVLPPMFATSCKSGKKRIEFLVENGVLFVSTGTKEYKVKQGESVTLVKGKELTLLNKSHEPVRLIKKE
ncbi:hypothetical protein TRFO_07409 [Tritrichomonas foetus]|uniref:Uncharacterized protein n=1 Tax=Tritrichomonas foetus TaxID=1144522 RepID=A0A1J4JWD1_9EUKA|nr:hypothetical protein TRFO_07409 [Tritrichomonas foetus]|eukprot:OHT01836.1 hypothetical protein TRFO_07409 [Tritrichomonas foetus]